jgi:hypothetical protein
MDVLADFLPDGHYYFRASVAFSNHAAMTDVRPATRRSRSPDRR